eukprot:4212450-Amphidinium_carterae.1
MPQPVFDANTARWVRERPPQQQLPTWRAKLQYTTAGHPSQPHQTKSAWSGIGLGAPATCRPLWRRYGMKCGQRFAGHQFWRHLQLSSWGPFHSLCAKRHRLV